MAERREGQTSEIAREGLASTYHPTRRPPFRHGSHGLSDGLRPASPWDDAPPALDTTRPDPLHSEKARGKGGDTDESAEIRRDQRDRAVAWLIFSADETPSPMLAMIQYVAVVACLLGLVGALVKMRRGG